MTETPPNPSTAWSQSLIDVLGRQQALVDQLVPLARQQADLIAAGETDALLGLLGRRQQLIDELTGSQQQLGDLTEGLDQRLAALPREQAERIRSLIDHIGECLSDVMERDEQDQKSLEASRREVKKEISDVGAAKKARNAYMQAKAVDNRFADQRG
ncbi:MAG: flagellar export chaperone FlgN [Phycisphaerales bacterium]|nr:MAG: flagellar export chaperone FlgN [Phycisphaerales bacterium]